MTELVSEIVIDATPETIWPFLTEVDRHVEWMGTEAEIDPRPGGVYRVLVQGEHRAGGEFVEVVPRERVVFTFGWDQEGNPITPGSTTVEITLHPEGDKTRVRLVHRDLPADAIGDHTIGWNHYLDRLSVSASGGVAGPDAGPGGTATLDLHAAHALALGRTRRIVAAISPAQLSLPTPCETFDVQALLGHLVVGNRRFTAMAGGAPAISVPLDPGPTDDWSAAYDASAAAVEAAWQDPEALERTAELPMVTVPGVVALAMHVVETVVHGWDLAKATGQPTDIDDELCAFAWDNVQGVTDDLRGPDGPFGPAVDVPADASATDRLVAWLGRQP